MVRRKIFSEKPRRRIFSSSEPILRTLVCRDCGEEVKTGSTSTQIICPKCGGTRFDEKRISIYNRDEKMFSTPSNKLEKLLKTYSGMEMNTREADRLFSEVALNSDGLVEKGFAEKTDGGILIDPNAYMTEKLFSKLIISITKIMDLPEIESRENAIESLRGSLSPRGIMIIKKAHGIVDPVNVSSSCCPSPLEGLFSETSEWAKDSGIENDLEAEFGGEELTMDELFRILNERYDDAPTDIVDYLKKVGIIETQGNMVKVKKNNEDD